MLLILQGPDQTAYRLAFGVVSHHSADSTKYAMRILMRHIKNVHLLYAYPAAGPCEPLSDGRCTVTKP